MEEDDAVSLIEKTLSIFLSKCEKMNVLNCSINTINSTTVYTWANDCKQFERDIQFEIPFFQLM